MSSTKPANYKGTGRPTKLTPQLQENICKYIAAGNYLVTACQACGIDKSTYLRWLGQAEQEANNGGGLYHDFGLAVKRAEAEQEAAIAQRLIDGALPGQRKKVIKTNADGTTSEEVTETGGDWLAAATYLERRHPDRWGRKDRTAITIDETKHVTITRVTVVLPAGVDGQVVEGEAREVPQLDASG